ncbi:MAG: M56 family metallopeptidase [Gemmatimonadota bacterium]
MLELMGRAVIVGALVSGAAYLFERALRHLHSPTRYAWTFALLATTLLPLIPRVTTTSPVPDFVPQVTVPAIVITGNASESAFDRVVAVWLLFSVLVGLAYLVSYLRLRRARRDWRVESLADQLVYMSDRFGPAIFGFIAPRIVVPEWVSAVSREEQRLIVLHEREHIAARDQLQRLLTIAASIVMPWHPFVWLQARRLRFALEADCDQRVLAAVPNAERYATLLVDVGSRQMGLLLTPALAEHRNGLERRIVMLGETIRRNRWKAAAMLIAGLIVTVVSCESRLPTGAVAEEPAKEPEDQDVRALVSKIADEAFKREADVNAKPTFTPYTKKPELSNRDEVVRALVRNYPPLLRAAGIGGKALVWLLIDESGNVVKTEIKESSGQAPLDQAAMHVAAGMRFLPAENEGVPAKVWIVLPIVFSTK